MSLSETFLPILNNVESCGSPRPIFGSPDVARYGAIGLAVEVEESAEGDGIAPPDAPANRSEDGRRDVFRVSRRTPLAMIDGLAHHLVDDTHLWIGVAEGKLIVADDADHELMTAFLRGDSPVEAAAHLGSRLGLGDDPSWNQTVGFIGRLAAAGMIRGIQGYHSVHKIRPQLFARFHLTNRCQLECIHCYTSSGPHLSSDAELPVERWLRLVDDFAENGGKKILFTGGEALVYRGCMEIMRRARERGIHVTLFSNGILIPRHVAELEEIADVVQISLDGPTEESHDVVRGPGSYRKAIRAIRLLLDAGIETRVSTTIMVDNWAAIRRNLPRLIDDFADTKLTFRDELRGDVPRPGRAARPLARHR